MATLSALDPAEVALGSEDVVLRCVGEGFTEASVIIFAGNDEPTTFVSATEVTTGVKPSLPWGEVTVDVSVDDSAALPFTFLPAVAPPEAGWLLEELKHGNVEALDAASDAEIQTIKAEYEAWADTVGTELKEQHRTVIVAIEAELGQRDLY